MKDVYFGIAFILIVMWAVGFLCLDIGRPVHIVLAIGLAAMFFGIFINTKR